MADWEQATARGRRRGRLVVVTGLAAALLAAAVWAGVSEGGDDGETTPEPSRLTIDHEADPPGQPPEVGATPEGEEATDADGEGTDADASLPDREPVGEWRELAGAPLTGGAVRAFAWTGEELLVWRGQSDQLAAYDPDRDRWRRAAEAPVYATGRTAATWTGEELVVLGAYDAQGGSAPDRGAAYQPSADSWRPVAPAPEGQWAWESAVWDGEAVVVIGSRFSPVRQPAAVAYDPERDEWRELPAPPIWGAGRALRTAALGGHVLAVGVTPISGARAEYHAVSAYDPAERAWSDPEPAPYEGLWSVDVTAVADQGAIAIVGAVHDRVWRDVTGIWSPDEGLRWEALPSRPLSGQHAPALIDTDDGLVAWAWGADQSLLLDEREGEWVPLAASPLGRRRDAALAWTGDELLVWGGRTGQAPRDDGAAWRPTSRASPQ